MEILVRMPPTLGSTGNIIEVVNPFYIKRDVPLPLHETEVPTRFCNFRKLNDFTIFNITH